MHIKFGQNLIKNIILNLNDMKKQFCSYVVLSLLLGFFMSSCTDNSEALQDRPIKGVSFNTIFFIEYVNADGTNILHNDSPIEVFYEKNGIAEKVERLYLAYPYGFEITGQQEAIPDGSGELCVKVFASDYYSERKTSTTFIKLGDYPVDTIQCLFEMIPNGIYIYKIWHNGILVWDRTTKPSSLLIQIIK